MNIFKQITREAYQNSKKKNTDIREELSKILVEEGIVKIIKKDGKDKEKNLFSSAAIKKNEDMIDAIEELLND